jgi:ABC-type multidrug transport system fused ATPase/permease subunit
MSRLLNKGSQQQKSGKRLTKDDLFPVPISMEAAYLTEQFRRFHHESSSTSGSSKRSKQRHLLYTLWRLAAPTFVPAGCCQLLTVCLQVALPLLVRELLLVLENHPGEKVVEDGLPYVLAVFFCIFLNAFGDHRHRHLALQSGIVMRAATASILYEHVLQLTPSGRTGLTSGEVTNLIATDTQKLFEVSQEAHYIWALPLSIVLVTICLILILGPTTLIGIAMLILFVPLVERITTRMFHIRQKRVEETDKRIEIVNAMLQGVSQEGGFLCSSLCLGLRADHYSCISNMSR